MSCVKSTMNNPGNDYSEAETSALKGFTSTKTRPVGVGGEDVSMCHFRTSGNLFPYLFYMEEWLQIRMHSYSYCVFPINEEMSREL